MEQDPTCHPAVDDSLTELNIQLSKELRQLQTQLEASSQQIAELEAQNALWQADVQQIKEKNASHQREQQAEFQEQLAGVNEAREKVYFIYLFIYLIV